MKMAWEYITTNIETAIEEQDNESSVTVQYFNAWMELFGELSGNINAEWLTKI